MAIDLAGKDYSPGQIQISTWDETNNAVRVNVVTGGGGGSATAANQVTQIGLAEDQLEVAEDTLVAIEALDSALLSQSENQSSIVIDFSSTPITTADFVEIIASCGEDIKEIEIYNGTASAFSLGFGGIGVEVVQLTVFPGGNGRIPCQIPNTERVSLKALNADATTGIAAINFYV